MRSSRASACWPSGCPARRRHWRLLNDAVKKGGAFASSRVGGLSGAFIPVSEDLNISEAVRNGHLCLEKLEAMTSVCSVGLDMIAIPGDTSPETISAIIADEMAIGVINNKTTAARLIPVPGKTAGDQAFFGGLMGHCHHHSRQQRKRRQSLYPQRGIHPGADPQP